jgi:hypothetical protein
VKALLALAESPNPHEAEAAARMAHRLMRRHNLREAEAHVERAYGFRQVGPAKGRFDPWEKRVAGVLAGHFFVDAIWVPVWLVDRGRGGRALELCGTPENLELAAWVHDFLRETAERLWRDHARAGGLGDRDRRRYLHGVVAGFEARLVEEGRACDREGLVWAGDPGLDAWVRRRHRHLRSTRVAVRGGDAFRAGQAAGRELRLHRPITTSGGGGRLLG